MAAKFTAYVGEVQEQSGRGSSWSEQAEFATEDEARAYVFEFFKGIVSARIEYDETEVTTAPSFSLCVTEDGEFRDGVTFEQMEQLVDELDGLADENFSVTWSIKSSKAKTVLFPEDEK
jgi:hypothetical protein